MYDISFHVVEVSGVLLIIMRGYRWLKVDWLVLVLVAMVAPLRPRTIWRTMIRGPEPETTGAFFVLVLFMQATLEHGVCLT